MFDVHIVHATITSIDRARCEQSRKNTLFLEADEAIQTTGTFEFHISSWSFQHSITFRTSVVEVSILFTSGSAHEADREQVTHDAATEHVPDQVEGQVSSSGFQLQRNIQLCHVCQEMFESGTKCSWAPESTIMDNLFGLITCSENRNKLTNHISSRPRRVASLASRADSEDPPGDKTSLKIAATATTFSEFALLCSGVDRPGGATSDHDESGSEVNTACAEEEEFSGHDFAQCGGFVICPNFLHRSLSLFAFLPLLPLPPAAKPNSCVRICIWRSAYRESLRCMRLCGHLWHPFQLRCR